MRVLGAIAGWLSAIFVMCVLGWIAIFNPRKADELLMKAMNWAKDNKE